MRRHGADESVEVHVVGIRAIRLPTELGSQPIKRVIMAGLGGALDPTLSIGDIVLDDWPTELRPWMPHRRGRILCSREIVATPAAKRALFEKTGALAVDMESDPAREFAKRLGVSFISIRAISDSANHSLDPLVLKMVDEFGRPKPMAIAGAILQRPTLVPELKQLGANANLAAKRLAACILDIATELTDGRTL